MTSALACLKLNSTLHDTGTLHKAYLHGPPIIPMSQYKLTIFKRLIQSVRSGIVTGVTLACVSKLYR